MNDIKNLIYHFKYRFKYYNEKIKQKVSRLIDNCDHNSRLYNYPYNQGWRRVFSASKRQSDILFVFDINYDWGIIRGENNGFRLSIINGNIFSYFPNGNISLLKNSTQAWKDIREILTYRY